VTFCTGSRIDYFGEIIDENMILNDYGKIVQESIMQTDETRIEIELHEYIIMPNHIHMIIVIKDIPKVGSAGMRSESQNDSRPQ